MVIKLNIYYKNSNDPKETESLINQLIDEHSHQTFSVQDDLKLYHYAISAEVVEENSDSVQQGQGPFVGGIAFRQLMNTAHISALAVDPKYRSHNIGSRLIQEAELFLDQQGVHTVTLSTLSYQALNFYQKLGYQVYGQLEDLPRKGVTKYHLYKRLSAYSADNAEKEL